MKILIVEDDGDLREITKRSLLKEHYMVEIPLRLFKDKSL